MFLMDTNNRIDLERIVISEIYSEFANQKNSKKFKKDTINMEIIIPMFNKRNDEKYSTSYALSKLFMDIRKEEFPIKRKYEIDSKTYNVTIYDDFHDINGKKYKDILAEYSYRLRDTGGGKTRYSIYTKII